MPRPQLAWVRYGGPISDQELQAALGRYRAAILQPWEWDAAAALKAADPSMTVLAYQCFSSVRVYEPGPIYSSGINTAQAEKLGSFAENNGQRIEWQGYPGHFQQQVWNRDYQRAWVESVADFAANSPFDGIMADNDVFDDYYGHGLDMNMLRAGLDQMVTMAGTALAKVGKILVPNIAESRREKGRWARHSRFGGGFEECWIGWGTKKNERLLLRDIRSQNLQLRAPRLTIARLPGVDNEADNERYLRAALAAAWVFAPRADVAVTATAHDGYNASPWIEDALWDLGKPLGGFRNWGGGVFSRQFQHGHARIDLSTMTGIIDHT